MVEDYFFIAERLRRHIKKRGGYTREIPKPARTTLDQCGCWRWLRMLEGTEQYCR